MEHLANETIAIRAAADDAGILLLLNAGDTVALGTPIFTPYLEMPHLEDYDLKIVNVQAKQENRWQFDDAELKKLLDPTIAPSRNTQIG